MALTLNAEQKSIYDIFSGENQYIIPPYQRAYSWTNIQCKALFEDIKKAFYDSEQEGYFLGNIVLAKSREERNKLEVIDGQQRLTTLILLIKVLLSFDKDNKALYNAIWIKDRRRDEEIQRLETNVFMEKDFNYFKEVLTFDFSDNICEFIIEDDEKHYNLSFYERLDYKEHNLFEQNICYFYNELNKFSQHNDIFKFSDFLLDKIYILPIETEDMDANKAREKAIKIFETINNRGLNLSSSDRLKARLYSMALNELEHEDFIEKWKELEKKSNELEYTLDDIFDIYGSMIGEKFDIIFDVEEPIDFLLENKYSPFITENYRIIIDGLLKICDFNLFFIDIVQNSYKNEELAKWFQLVHQDSNQDLSSVSLYTDFYSYELDESKKMILLCKEIICNNSSVNTYKTHFTEYYKSFSEYMIEVSKKYLHEENFFLLIGLYLDTDNKAIYPYYFIEDRTKITKSFLIELYPELIADNTCEELINKAYKFIK